MVTSRSHFHLDVDKILAGRLAMEACACFTGASGAQRRLPSEGKVEDEQMESQNIIVHFRRREMMCGVDRNKRADCMEVDDEKVFLSIWC